MSRWPHLAQGLAFEWRRLRRGGMARLLLKAGLRAVSVALWVTLLPVTAVLHAAGFRRVTVFTDRIGHLAMEPDCLLKDERLGHLPRRRWFMSAAPGRVSNAHLLSYWEAHIPVVRSPAARFLLESMSRWWLMREDVSRYLLVQSDAQAAYRVHAQWAGRSPLLALRAEDEAWGSSQLAALGIPRGAWYVCVHVREGGFSPVDEELHAHRNGDIESATRAMREVVRRGGWVVRLGDASMKPLPPMTQVVDYAHSPLKSGRLDVVLCAKARFMLGNTSGIALLATVFGVPCAAANMIPTPTLWFGPDDLSIPKLLWSGSRGRYLRLREIMESEISEYRYAQCYDAAGIRPDENSAEDLEALVREMLDRLEGRFLDTPADLGRQRAVRSLFRRNHYATESCARMGALFLRAHARELGLPETESPPEYLAESSL